MNTKHISLAFAAAAALLAGCAKSPIETPSDTKGLTDLELTHVGSTEVKSVIDGTDFPTEGEIGLFLFTDEAATTPYGETGYTNVKYAYNSTKGKWTANPSIKVGSTPGYLYGYYPYSSESTDVKAIPVASSLNGDDVMYASKQNSPITDQTASQTAITMNHALARVSITVKNNGYTGNAKLTSIKFTGAKTSETGTLNATTGTISGTTKADVTLDVPTANQTITTTGSTYECLLVSSGEDESKQAVDLTLTIDGEVKTAKLSGDNGVIIAQNTKSNITITLSNKGISVSSVSIDEWKEVEVGGHKVTVKVADDVTPHDILTEAYVDGNNVIIKASSFQGRGLVCKVEDNAKCERSFTNGKFTFIISEICSNIEAVLGYAPLVTLNVQSDSNGKVWIGDDYSKTSGQFEVEQQVVIHALPNDEFRFFRWNDNNRETSRTITVGELEATYSASFISSDLIPGLFTVNSSGKQVFFSKGNLWYGKFNGEDAATFHLESNQYESTPSTEKDRDETHISHFMWCKSASESVKLYYEEQGATGSDNLFTNASPTEPNENFAVNGHKGFWRALSGGVNGEWKYLINNDNECGQTIRSGKYMCGVKVCGRTNCLILLPDDWKWGENGVGSGWFSEYSESTYVQWSTMENAGAVCLPAAGYRKRDDAFVLFVGNYGYYWSASASPDNDNDASCLNFYDDFVHPGSIIVISDRNEARNRACAVRLVTESK